MSVRETTSSRVETTAPPMSLTSAFATSSRPLTSSETHLESAAPPESHTAITTDHASPGISASLAPIVSSIPTLHSNGIRPGPSISIVNAEPVPTTASSVVSESLTNAKTLASGSATSGSPASQSTSASLASVISSSRATGVLLGTVSTRTPSNATALAMTPSSSVALALKSGLTSMVESSTAASSAGQSISASSATAVSPARLSTETRGTSCTTLQTPVPVPSPPLPVNSATTLTSSSAMSTITPTQAPPTVLTTMGPESARMILELVASTTVYPKEMVVNQQTKTVVVTETITVTVTRFVTPTPATPVADPTTTTTTTTRTQTRTVTLRTTLATAQLQTVTSSISASPATGSVITSLSTQSTVQPFNTTVIPSPSRTTLVPITTGSNLITSVAPATPTAMPSGNIFVPLALDAPPPNIASRSNHPAPRLGITNQTSPPQTNKFYANFFLGNRQQGTWTHPYSVSWAGGGGVTNSWGIAVSYVSRIQTVYGPGNPAAYYINPLGLQSLILSANELGSNTQLTMDSLRAFSANVNLSPYAGAPTMITFPLVQGMGFVTGVYNNATPLLQSSIFFTSIVYDGRVYNENTVRYHVTLADGASWLVYMTPSDGTPAPTLTLQSNARVVANHPFTGSLQVARNPAGSASMAVYDNGAGTYPLRGAVSAQTDKNVGTYSLTWTKGGNLTRSLVMFALPHHVQSFVDETAARAQPALKLWTTTKGMATAVMGDSWTMREDNLPYALGFSPWRRNGVTEVRPSLPASAFNVMRAAAISELNQSMMNQTQLDSMYFSGKAFAKFASVVLTAQLIIGDNAVASAGLLQLKQAFATFVNNRQQNPLVYDSSWGGAVSSAGYAPGQAMADFGNTFYNDHHFHYGYFVYTAAVIAYLDPQWLNQGTNRAWVNMLIRDYANPASNDGYFPFSRMFDWYHGHSWAHGLFESADGKDEESTSEDSMASYALKLWGIVIGDANMEARGNLMLSIQARSFNNYFLMQKSNAIMPAQFIGNKAAGITFENKQDHTTYFGTNIEYIEGIHMLPIMPHSKLTRNATFVDEEWNTYFSNGRADRIAGGWRGVLMSNLALIDPRQAWNFFAQPNFDNANLDGGASRTWYLALAAAWGGLS